MKKNFLIIILIILYTNVFGQSLAGKTFFASGPEIEQSYSFTRDRFTYNFDVFYLESKSLTKSYFYEIKYINKIPFIFYGKEYSDNSDKQLILFNDDYIFLFDNQEKKAFLEPVAFYPFCSGKYTTDAKGDLIVNSVFNRKYSSVLKEKDHEYKIADGNYVSPWVPDLKKDKKPSITFSVGNYTKRIILINGFVNPEKPYLYEQNSRVKTAEVIFRNTAKKESETRQIILEDTPNPQYIFVPGNFIADEIEIKIIDTYEGNKYTDIAVSYIGY